MKEHIRKRKIMAVTLTGSLANFLLLVFKFVAGVLGHSSAMIADAVHSLSDFVTDVIVLLFINIIYRPNRKTKAMTMGTESMKLWLLRSLGLS